MIPEPLTVFELSTYAASQSWVLLVIGIISAALTVFMQGVATLKMEQVNHGPGLV